MSKPSGCRRADAGAERGDQRGDLLGADQLVEARLLDVEHLAAQRQDRLELAVAPLLGRAAGRIALDDVELGLRRILFLAVGELAGQADAVQHALAARHLARLARGLARTRGLDDLAADDLGVGRPLEQVGLERAGHHFLDRRPHFRRHQLVLGLRAELRLRHLHRQDAGQALAHVVAAGLDLGLLGQLVFLDVLVQHPRHRRAQAGDVRAAVLLRDVVGEREQAFVVAVVPLHRHLDAHRHLADRVAAGVEDVRVQDVLGLVDVLHEALDAAGEGEVLLLAGALVDQLDAHAVVQEGQFAQALRQHVVVEVDVEEDLLVRQEVHLGAAAVGRAGHLHRRDLDVTLRRRHGLDHPFLHDALAEFQVVHLAIAPDRQAQPLAERVDAGDADPVQAARHLVAVLVELAAGMQLGQRDLGGRAPGFVLVVVLDPGRDAAAVVDHRDRVVGVDRDDDVVAVAGQRLVDRVVDDLEDHVVQAGAVVRVADVHPGPLAHGFQPLEDLDAAGAVIGLAVGFLGRMGLIHRRIRYC